MPLDLLRPAGLALLCGAALAAGCGPDGPRLYDVSGRVTFDGRPVPAGTIVFEPDATKGNDGPQGTAAIVDGVYDTARGGRGTVGGPQRVTVLGCDGVTVSETSPQGRRLFPPYSSTADLPQKTGTFDIEVPRAAGGPPGR